MRKVLIEITILGLLLTIGCSMFPVDFTSTSGQKAGDEELSAAGKSEADKEPISLAGIRLGASAEEVVGRLGSEYREEKFDDGGFFGESFAIWHYEGIDVVIGLESEKVLQLEAYIPQFVTQNGDKVGNEASKVLEKYRAEYPEYEGANSDGPLGGWFQLDESTLLIFSFNEDRSRFNQVIPENSKVEAITLGYTYFFD